MFYNLRLSVWIALIGSCGMRDDRSIELLPEFAAKLGDAALGVFGKLLRGSSILNGVDGLAGVILKIAEHAVELLLHVADFGLLFLFSFGSQALLFPLDILLALAQAHAFRLGFAQFGVKFVEELADIAGLRPKARSRAFNDRRIQSQALRDVDASGRSRHADSQLIRGF